MMEFAKTWKIPAALLAVMFALMLGSSLGDSLTTDEDAHIPAGYSYVRYLDFRLNPEHPPLVKALAGLPLLFLNLNFPTDIASWTTDVNGQWDQGRKFIFGSGNNPDQIIFWARLPMILLTILLGILFYWWTQKNFGRRTASLAILLFAFSPTLIAHGRLVTTDIGASIGFLIGIATFLKFLERPTWKNTLIAGAALGIAALLKYSTFLLVPIYGVLLLVWAASQLDIDWKSRARLALYLIGKTIVIGAIAVVAISLVYGVFTWNYPQARQESDSQYILRSFGNRALVNIQDQLVSYPMTRPFGHYFLGLLMVVQRSAGGNTNYFLGEVTNGGSYLYFPIVYLAKETLAFHILTLMAMGLALMRLRRARPWGFKRIGYWVRNNFALFASAFFIIFYWAYSMKSPLNIGVRHVLPTFPFIYILVSREIASWLRGVQSPAPADWRMAISAIYRNFIAPIPRYLVVGILLLWLIAETLLVYPNFLSYYNELAGGTANGYKIATDSNYDWGQDLKRLDKYLRTHGIDEISLEYFCGGDPSYYLGDKFTPWWSSRGPALGYFAISATLLEGATEPTGPGFSRKPEDSYLWLKNYQPVGRAGYSIFIYQLP